MAAISLEDYLTNEFKNDARYVKWYARYLTKKDDVSDARLVPLYPCAAEDYAKFYPPDNRSSGVIERIRAAPNRDMLCLNWEEAGIDLYGTESSGTYAELDIGVIPCNVRMIPLGDTDDRI